MAASRRERKVVTVVFCDLVGFTSQAESMDPEDVEAILRPYHARVRSELERHGGTVEKFIGDAVMSLFGAPVAHEDDPERAARAALAIRDFAVEEGLELRIGIPTGEVLVSLGARPAEGEGMASGDVVNTAARLQSAAPINGILADETTYRATRQTIEYGEASAVEAKGKSQPVSAWQVLDARARFGVDVAHEARTELVGRERELSVLRDAFARARHGHTPQLVTLVGVPGLGKSRLVYELSQIVDADPELVTWRQGRCLAYGDGVTLWALGEIVKAQAGILEQDTADEVSEKVHRAVKEVLPNEKDTAWVEPHLLALVGQADESELGGDRRGAAFAAWRRFLEALAEQRPLILVFEDLHWADESLLDFVDALVDWVSDVPLLVVATSRPELLERRPAWGGGKLNATTLALAPLSNDETASLIARLLERSVLPVESQQALLERAGGNPLYAEQFADLYVERGSAEDLPLPETLQGIISARLDVLPASEKELLRDAAVVGKVFWADVLQREPGVAATELHSLERKGFVRRQKRSSVEGEDEFAFAHALVRDVAYGQIARADRAEKHRRTAEWIDTLGRTEDHAEMLAYHWRSALEFARAAGQAVDDIRERARVALREAGDRAFALNAYPAAAEYYQDALALWPDDDIARAEVLFRRARALYIANEDSREKALEDARDALLAAGDRETAAEAESFLALVWWYRGRTDRAQEYLRRATELAGDRPSPAKVRVLSVLARTHVLSGGAPEEGMLIAREAIALAEALGLDELKAHAIATIGTAKTLASDPSATADLERALDIALEINSPLAAPIVNNLAVASLRTGDLRRTEDLYIESRRLAERFGDAQSLLFLRPNTMFIDFMRGRWDDALREADLFIAECERGSPHVSEDGARVIRGVIRNARGDHEGGLEDHVRAVALGREGQTPAAIVPALAVLASDYVERGQMESACSVADELLSIVQAYPESPGMGALNNITPFAERLGIRNKLRQAVELAPPTPWMKAVLLGLDADFRGAAEIFAQMPNPTLEARCRLYAAERLIESGQRQEGGAELGKALAFYRSVGAIYYVSRAESLLAKTA